MDRQARKIESEKTLEARLRRETARRGGMCVKLTSQFQRGLPDRLLLMPGGRAAFCELKSTGRRPTPLQLECHRRLRALGFAVRVADSTEGLDALLRELDAGAAKPGQSVAEGGL